MIKNVHFYGKQLTIISDNGKERNLDMDATIYKFVYTDKRVAVLLSGKELHNTQYHNRNIICLDEKGQMLWRIVNQDTLSPSKEKTHYSYSSLELKNNNCVRVGTFFGMEVDVDINTGKFIGDWEFTK